METEYKIYKITNKITKKIYIGKTKLSIDDRFNKHIKNAKNKINRRLYDSMNHHGSDNFVVELLCVVGDNDSANNKEKYYIKVYKSNIEDFGYNMTIGGDGGDTGNYHYGKSPYDWWVEKYGTEKANEIKQRVSEKISEKMKLFCSGLTYEDRYGDETESIKEKISNTLKNKIKNGEIKPNIKGLRPHITGDFKHTDETKEKIRNFRLDKTYDDLYGVEKAKQIKEKKKLLMSGENNPNYKVDMSYNEKLILLTELKNELKLFDISKKIGRSLYELKKYLKSINILNVQKFRSNDNYKNILQKYINELNA
jgi:group I intron endonuclease